MKINFPRPWKNVLCYVHGIGWTVGHRDGRRAGDCTWHYENRIVGSTYTPPEYWQPLPPRPGSREIKTENAGKWPYEKP